jgi:DnaJ-class molecular chaperone
LDKKKVTVSFDQVIAHGTSKVVGGLGFTSKGNLIVNVEVEFPKYVDIESKKKIINLLT